MIVFKRVMEMATKASFQAGNELAMLEYKSTPLTKRKISGGIRR